MISKLISNKIFFRRMPSLTALPVFIGRTGAAEKNNPTDTLYKFRNISA